MLLFPPPVETQVPDGFPMGRGLGDCEPLAEVTGELGPAGGTACLASLRRAAAKLAWLLAFDCMAEFGEEGPEESLLCSDGWTTGDDDTV